MKVYIFPRRNKKSDSNPYVSLMENAFSMQPKTNVISMKGGIKHAILDFPRCISADLLIVNWPENLGERRLPLIQLIIFSLVLFVAKVMSVRIIWVLHNKENHKGQSWVGRLCVRNTAKYATVVLTHSKEGCSYYREHFKNANVVYFPHPPYMNKICVDSKQEIFDIIIWGEISPYKRVVDFLEYSEKNKNLNTKRIMVCGSCSDGRYLERIKHIVARNENIVFQCGFIDNETLSEKINASKVVLFTYDGRSVLSSGALVYSLPFCKNIIGPKSGAFKDLEELGLVNTYESFDDIENLLTKQEVNIDNINNYLSLFSWNHFIDYLSDNTILNLRMRIDFDGLT